MKRLLIITDSLGAPRTTPELCPYDDTWPKVVKAHAENQGYDVILFTENGLDSFKLLRLVESKLKLYKPSMVLLQFGIVDCAPRVFTDREKLIFRILHLHKFAAYIGKKYHATLSSLRDNTVVSCEDFRKNIVAISQELKGNAQPGCKILHIPIGLACKGYVKISPSVERKITQYNRVLEEESDIFISAFYDANVEKIYTADHHHLNKVGHALLGAAVLSSMEDLWDNV